MQIKITPAKSDETVRKVNKSISFVCNIEGNLPAIKLATAEERNQKPIKREAIFFGETLDTIDKPMGERHSSPKVCKK